MESIVRAAVVYVVLLVLFRIAGKRSLAEVTSFDLVLLLIISEATQQAMIDTDNSMTNSLLLVTTLIGMNILFSVIATRWKPFQKLIEDVPLVILEDGRPLLQRMRKERVEEDEILEAARQSQGLERLDQIKYAILERTGHITIVPK
jgi:Predicted membrane protein